VPLPCAPSPTPGVDRTTFWRAGDGVDEAAAEDEGGAACRDGQYRGMVVDSVSAGARMAHNINGRMSWNGGWEEDGDGGGRNISGQLKSVSISRKRKTINNVSIISQNWHGINHHIANNISAAYINGVVIESESWRNRNNGENGYNVQQRKAAGENNEIMA